MVLKILTYVNSAFMVLVLAGGFFGYRYVTSPQFEVQLKNKLMDDLTKIMPKAIDKKMPKITGVGLPM
jgi:hypothetical protein